MNDQARGLRDMARSGTELSSGVPRVIAVTSGKGGVGKTSIVLNTSIALASAGSRVVVLDADLGLGNIDVMLGIVSRYNLAHVAAGEVSLADIAVSGPGGIKIIPCGSGVTSLLRLPESERAVLVSALAALENEADFIVVDTGAGLSPGVVGFLAAVEEVVVVTTPEPTSIADAYATVKVVSCENPAAPVMLVVNMARDLQEAEDAAEKITLVAKRFLSVNVKLLGFVPRDQLVTKAVMQQVPFVVRYPSCPASRAVGEIAERLQSKRLEGSSFRGFVGQGLVGFLGRIAARS
ncbi:MAG: MinD/ParA family protein [Firmicutes bacterium]|jgi:flagellar biosynthesis protein FlhG|nr:MinD/ParA family protein [Bacillota bacterium]MDH7495380.1 MinD/ParA family protein [Bacillota bacterium]